VKIYALMRHIDYEGSDVMAVYRDENVAKAWLAWVKEHSRQARDTLGDRGGFYDTHWQPVFSVYPAGSDGDYTIDSFDTVSDSPPNV
jgi:hypothetical protein